VGTPKDEALASLEAQGLKPYFIPSGASTHPLGGLGFARWAFELAEQEEALGVFFDTIVVALASGSTLGGMVAGFKLLEKVQQENGLAPKPRKLIGVVAMPNSEIKNLVVSIARTAAEKIGLDPIEINGTSFVADERFSAGAYGKLDEATSQGIKELAKLEGILVDPVYGGKAVTGLIAMARNGELSGSKNVLYCHTGGQSSMSAYPSLK